MKTLYRSLILILLTLATNGVFAQLLIVKAVAIDSSGNGMTDAIEFKFNQAVDDSKVDGANEINDWWASNYPSSPNFETYQVSGSGFSTRVSRIASASIANDEFITIYFGNNAGGNFADDTDSPFYYKYIKGTNAFEADTTSDVLLNSVTPVLTEDASPPKIVSVTVEETGLGSTSIIEDTIRFKVELQASEASIVISPTAYNLVGLTWTTVDDSVFYSEYVIAEGNIDQPTPLNISITAKDANDNISNSVNTSVIMGIDANKPVIEGVSFSPAADTVLQVGETINVTITASGETGFDIILDDYDFNGRTIMQDPVRLTDAAGGTYTFSYVIAEGDNDIADNVAIPFSFVIYDDAGNASDAYITSPAATSCPAIDGNKPVIEGVSFSPAADTVLQVGETINVTITASGETGFDIILDDYDFNGRTITQDPVRLTDAAGGTYTFSYVIAEGDNDIADNVAIPFSFVIYDDAGNASDAYITSPAATSCPAIDGNKPVIEGVSFSPAADTVLQVGETINVTITASGETGFDIILDDYDFNGRTITQDPVRLTDAAGGTYTFSYVIAEGDNDIADNVAIPFSFVIYDDAGNASDAYITSPAATSCPAIDGNKPVIEGVSFSPAADTVLQVGETINVTITASGETGFDIILDDYDFNGRTIMQDPVRLTDAAGGTYTFSYVIAEGDNDIADNVAIPFSFVIYDDAGNASDAYITSPAATSCPAIDGNKPVIEGVSFSPAADTVLQVGETINVTITASGETGFDIILDDYDFNGRTIMQDPVRLTDAAGGTYTFSYVIAEGDNDIADNVAIPFSFVIYDDAGNASDAYITSPAATSCPAIDGNKPVIEGVSFSPAADTVLQVGETINVTITASGETGFDIILDDYDFNGRTITQDPVRLTDAAGGTYTFSYVIAEGDNDIADNVAIPFSFVIYDGAGNASDAYITSPAATSCPAIDGNKPVIEGVSFSPAADTVLQVGETINVTITASGETGFDIILDDYDFNGRTIMQDPVRLTDAAGGTYTFSYVIAEGDNDIADNVAIPFSFVIYDDAGNASDAYITSPAATSCPAIDGNKPVIEGVSFSPAADTVLQVGETINVTITASGETGFDIILDDYDFNGRTITQDPVRLTDAAGGTYTFSYVIAEGDNDIADNVAIPFSFVIYDDAGNASDAYITSPAATSCPAIDGNKPVIEGVSFSPAADTVLQVGETINVTITASGETGFDIILDDYDFNGRTIMQDPVRLTDAAGGTYTFSYVIAEGDNDIADNVAIPFSFVIYDDAGNASDAYITSPAATSCPAIDGNKPVIEGVSFSPAADTVLQVGETINVTITASGETGFDIILDDYDFNGRTIMQDPVRLTDAAGGTYTFSYVIAEGDFDRADNVAIPFSFVIYDDAGNVSEAYDNIDDGTDAGDCPAIDANTPAAPTVDSDAETSGTLGVGDAIVFTVTPALAEPGAVISPTSYNSVGLTWDDVNGDGTEYEATYVIGEGDADQTAVLELGDVTITDAAGNTSLPTDYQGIDKFIDAHTPDITAVNITPRVASTVVGIGGFIDMLITTDDIDTDLVIDQLIFNGQNISTITPNGSGNYTFEYQVDENDGDVLSTVPIAFKIELHDDGGNSTGVITEVSAVAPGAGLGIDSKYPNIVAATFVPGSGTVLAIGEDVEVVVTLGLPEVDLSVNAVTINGKSVSSVSKNGDGTFSVVHTITDTDNDILDSQAIPISLKFNDLGGNPSNTYTTSTAAGCPGIDVSKPEISSVTFIPGNLNSVGIGETIEVTINTVGAETKLSLNTIKFNTKDITSITNNNDGSYKFVYAVVENDNVVLDADLITFSIELDDEVGNTSVAYTELDLAADNCPGIDSKRPVISDVSFVPGNGNLVGVGGNITATISTALNDLDLVLNAITFNNRTISTLTPVGDGTYTFIYTVNEDDGDVLDAALIPFSIVLEDGVGNLTPEYTESDLVADNCPGIDSDSPEINNVFFTPGNGFTSIIGETIRVDVIAKNSETGLTASTFKVNGVDVSSTFVSDGGGNYHANYTVASLNTDRSDAVKLPIEIVLNDLSNNPSLTFTQADIVVDNSPGVDGNKPIIDGVSFSPVTGNILKVGDGLQVTISASSEAGLDVTKGSFSLNGKSITPALSDITSGNYRFTYIIEEGDIDRLDSQVIPFSFTLFDNAGNESDAYTHLIAGTVVDACPGIDANKPVLNGVSFSPATGNVLKVGDGLQLTISASSETGLDVSAGSFELNGKVITPTLTDATGGNYTFTYTIQEGDNDILDSEVIPFSFTLFDDAGNESDVYNNIDDGTVSDDCPGIDAHTPVISGVSFNPSNGVVKVGGTIEVTISTLLNDLDLDINSISFNNKTISSFTNNPGGTYTFTYTVGEDDGDIIDVSEVIPFSIVLDDAAGNTSSAYTHASIVANDCPGIDSDSPEINSVISDANVIGMLKVGDSIQFTITPVAQENNLTFTPLTYNDGNINWTTANSGLTYTASYEVEEGQTDRPTVLPLGNVNAKDINGNISITYNVNDIQKTIDANSPKIIDFSVPQNEMLFGDVVRATISLVSDTGNYILNSGSVASFPIDSIEKFNNTTYYAYFKIANLGYDIQSTQDYSIANLVLSDFAGNISTPFSKNISQLNDPIYTILPSGKVTGSYPVCEGDSVELFMRFTGSAPWSIQLDNGTSIIPVTGITENNFYHKIQSVNNTGIDADTIIYKISQVEDVNGNVKINSGADSAIVYVHMMPDAEITYPLDERTYNVSTQEDTLKGIENVGIFNGTALFTGEGVLSSKSKFYPKSVGPGSYDIFYNYITEYGCADSDTITINVISASALIYFPDHGSMNDYLYCDYETPFMVTGENINNKPGTFSIYGYSGSAIVNTNADTAYINPTLLSAGDYTLIYTYDDGGVIEIQETFTIESVSNLVNITDLFDQCADYDTIQVKARDLIPTGGNGEYFFSGSAGAFKYNINDPNKNSGYFLPDSIIAGSYDLKYVYTTPNGCKSDTINKTFVINPLPNVSFSMNSVYNIDQGSTTISGSPLGGTGVFTPLSFMSNNGDGTAEFDPADAGLGIHLVKYTYEDAKGCINSQTVQVEVNKALGSIESSSGSFQYCYYGAEVDTIIGIPNPTDGTAGSFYIDDVLISPESDNRILFNPANYLAGDHVVKFTYSNGTTDYDVYKTVNIDSIENVSITDLNLEYCKNNNTEISLGVNPKGLDGIYEFSGNGITDLTINDELAVFNPSLASLGVNAINLKFTRDYSGCSKYTSKNVTINKVPEIKFDSLINNCVVKTSDKIIFSADTVLSDSVNFWEWRYRGIYTSNDQKPAFVSEIGTNTMRLTLRTVNGCTAFIDSTFIIGTRIDLDFKFENECHGEAVSFELLQGSIPDDTISVNWNFGGDGIADISDKRKPTFQYDEPGAYYVVYEENLKSCGRIADTVKVIVRPSVDLSSGAYQQDFEDTPDLTGWVIEDFVEGANNSWEWGIPLGTKINPITAGSNAFVTNLDGNYSNLEKGMVTSPCFDFSNMQRPMMKIDFISHTESGKDGAVIQYTLTDGTWVPIGIPFDGVNWFNSTSISSRPAAQGLGWTGTSGTDWQTAMYRLDDLKGRFGVRFRIVFASTDVDVDEGFAFDNIQFSERSRTVLLENFTNITDNKSNITQEDYIKPVLLQDSLDVIGLNYHTSFPGANDFNSFYPSGPSARALFYGVSGVPYSLIDGGDRKFDYSEANKLAESDVHKRMLIDPQFDISVKQNKQNGIFIVSSRLKAQEDILNEDLLVYVAIVEKTVVNGSDVYNNVLRTMLPDAAGILIDQDWLTGDSVNIYQTWSLPDGVEVDNLISIVFIQNEDTKEIYQTAYSNEYSTITAIDENIENFLDVQYAVYPNPMNDILTVKLYKDLTYELDINIYNSIGALVKTEKLNVGGIQKDIYTDDLPAGVYYIKLGNSDMQFKTKKIIKTN